MPLKHIDSSTTLMGRGASGIVFRSQNNANIADPIANQYTI
jgi:hypothetical protein